MAASLDNPLPLIFNKNSNPALSTLLKGFKKSNLILHKFKLSSKIEFFFVFFLFERSRARGKDYYIFVLNGILGNETSKT